MNAAENLQEEIADLQEKLKVLAEKSAVLRSRLAEARRELREEGSMLRETLFRERKKLFWQDKGRERWTPQWWTSDGWHLLADHVIGDGDKSNYGLLIAVFAELGDLEQFVLENSYGIGMPKRSLKWIGEHMPRGDYRTLGVSGTRARAVLWRAFRILRHRYNDAKGGQDEKED